MELEADREFQLLDAEYAEKDRVRPVLLLSVFATPHV